MLLWLMSVATSSMLAADSAESNEHQLLVRGLRNRGLYLLADRYCSDMLKRDGIGLTLQTDLIVEQILTRTAQAMSAGESTEDGWKHVVAPGAELLANSPEHPRRFLVQLQMALVDAARGKSIQQQVGFGIRKPEDTSSAISFYENARRSLEQLQRELSQAIPRAFQRTPTGEELSSERMQALSASVNYQLASCLTEIAGMYQPDDRLNRIDALIMVLDRVEQVRRQTGLTSGLNQACELLKIEALQLAGNRAAAQRELQRTESRKLTPENLQRFWQLVLNQPAEEAANNRVEQTISTIEARADNDPETEIAVLQFLVKQTKTSGSTTTLESVRSWTDRIQSRFGSSWGRFANRLLLEAAGESVAGVESSPTNEMAVDLAIRAGENALAEKRTGEAIDAFRTAASKLESPAANDNQIRQAFQIRVRIAELLAGGNDYPVAAKELQTISERFVTHELASAVHLRAVWYAQRLVRPNQPDSTELYQSLLQNQLERWGKAPATDQARLWRASFRSADQQWQMAIDDCLAVNPAGGQSAAAANEITRIMTIWFASIDRAIAHSEGMRMVQPVNKFAEQACESGIEDPMNAGWKLRSEFCGLGLGFGFLDVEQVRSLLDGLLSTETKIDSGVSESGIAVLAAAEVLGAGKADILQSLLARLAKPGEVTPGELAFLKLTSDADRSLQNDDLLRAQLGVANRLAKDLPAGEQLDFVNLNAAQLHLAVREYEPAIELLEPLAKALPDRMDVQLAFARGVSAIGTRQNDAISTWRVLATRLTPQSEPWFEAKHEIARLVLLSGKPGEAHQMLEFLKAVPPGWKDSKWASRLDDLLKKCRDSKNQ